MKVFKPICPRCKSENVVHTGKGYLSVSFSVSYRMYSRNQCHCLDCEHTVPWRMRERLRIKKD